MAWILYYIKVLYAGVHRSPTNRARYFNNDISIRTSSKKNHLDHGVGVATRSKTQSKCNVSAKGLIFPWMI
jgi:hypothetical protein